MAALPKIERPIIVLPARYDEIDRNERRLVREQYVEEQGGKCYHCSMPLSGAPQADIARKWINWRKFPPNFGRHPIHLHHDHDTGLTIGAVHARCNAVLWQYHGE